MKLYAEITKIDRERRMVFGYASTEALDSQGEVVRKEAIEAALPDYMRFANIREMHQPSAVGVAKEAEIDDKGLYLAARIVDDEAWRKVTEGVYKGFSIGGRVTQRDAVQKHVITGVELLEISLVDRPANPEAVIELYKASPEADRAGTPSAAGLLAEIDKLRASLEDSAERLRAMAKEERIERGDAAAPNAAKRDPIEPLQQQIAALAKRLAVIEAQPLPGKGALKAVAVAKEQDAGTAPRGETLDSFVARLAGLTAEKRAHELTKLALRLPQTLPR